MEDYSNNFLFFYSRNYTINLGEISDFIQKSSIKKVLRKISLKRKLGEDYDPLSERGGDTARNEPGDRGSFKATIKEVE